MRRDTRQEHRICCASAWSSRRYEWTVLISEHRYAPNITKPEWGRRQEDSISTTLIAKRSLCWLHLSRGNVLVTLLRADFQVVRWLVPGGFERTRHSRYNCYSWDLDWWWVWLEGDEGGDESGRDQFFWSWNPPRGHRSSNDSIGGKFELVCYHHCWTKLSFFNMGIF